MAMSRKDYVKFAQAFNDHMGQVPSEHPAHVAARMTLRDLHQNMMDIFAADNPNFDRTRFLDASGML